jgi:hypothetical protein
MFELEVEVDIWVDIDHFAIVHEIELQIANIARYSISMFALKLVVETRRSKMEFAHNFDLVHIKDHEFVCAFFGPY